MTDTLQHHELRLRLESVVIGECEECGRPVNALDAACRSEIREKDGSQDTYWYHARCIGCDEDETMRWAGCSGCAREWVQEDVEPASRPGRPAKDGG